MEKKRNLWVIPTDKPSRLYINLLDYLSFDSLQLRGSNQNIYITSDEEIKEGDWFLNKISMKTYKNIWDDYSNNIDEEKIILTTDQELIKDGVQAIDDEFLEWFVKNSSCEEVEVVKESYGICNSKDDRCYCYTQIDEHNCPNFIKEYKIIIPKEEPELTNICIKCGVDLHNTTAFICQEHPKNCKGIHISEETLREWADKEEPKQERSYSEEDLDAFRKFMIQEQNFSKSCLDLFIKQFKKK